MAVKFAALTETAIIPTRQTKHSAGYDLCADESAIIKPWERALIKTGVTLYLPSSLVGYVCSRSGLALKSGVYVLNAPGVIDADYAPNPIGVILANFSDDPFIVNHGDRIAQLVIADYYTTDDDLAAEHERISGFGSTGKGV